MSQEDSGTSAQTPEQENCKSCYVNDHWTLEVEQLGYQPLVDALKEKLDDCDSPYSFAVCGGWGSGKTSVLRYLMAACGGQYLRLDPADKLYEEEGEDSELTKTVKKKWEEIGKKGKSSLKFYACIWFNPWQHQFEETPLIALLNEMYSQFSSWAKTKQGAQQGLKMSLHFFDQLIASLTGLVAKKGFSFRGLLDAGKKAAHSHDEQCYAVQLDSQRFPLHFQQAVRTLAEKATGESKARLIIFIDDMDRIQPEQAYQLLESIKLLLHTPRCIFVFGIDYHRLVQRLARLEIFETSETYAREYLEKMFQSLVYLPQPKDEDFENFIGKQLEATGLRSKLAKTAPGLIPQDDDTGSEPEPIALQKFLSHILEKNPRKAKNFLNALKAKVEHLKFDKAKDSTKQLILVHFIRMIYPQVYAVLETDPTALLHLWLYLSGESPDVGNAPYFRFFDEVASNELLPCKPLDQEAELSEEQAHKQLLNMKYNTTAFLSKDRFRQHFVGLYNNRDTSKMTQLKRFF